MVATVIVAGTAIAAIFAATLSAFWRNWIFCASLNVTPVIVAPTIRAFVMFAFVNIAFVRLAFVKLESVRLVPTNVADIRFLPIKSEFGMERLL